MLEKPSPTTAGNKLPCRRQVLQVFYHLHNEEKTICEAATGAVGTAFPFWDKTRIPVSLKKQLTKKLEVLFSSQRSLRKGKQRSLQSSARGRDFKDDLDDLLDMGHQEALHLITIKEDKQFLLVH